MKFKILYLISITGICLLVIFLLYFTSGKYDLNESGFKRNYSKQLQVSRILPISSIKKIFAGEDSVYIYIQSTLNPLQLVLVNFKLDLVDSIQFTGIALDSIRATEFSTTSTGFVLENLVTNCFYYATVPEYNFNLVGKQNSIIAESIPLNDRTIVQRMILNNEFTLGKWDIPRNKFISFPNLLEKQVDGMFCKDGMLRYNKSFQYFIYTYHYRNEFICMDTSLNLLYKRHTIDTISRINFKVEQITSEGTLSISTPPKFVNLKSYTFGNSLYIQSGIRAENETRQSFQKGSSIDVYQLLNGHYDFSFQLPKYKNRRASDFIVHDSLVIASYPGYLIVYRLI